jgi:aspartyl-tRNA(Asn)/glutamyl-tRNA(Gln) amidotransferase subunit C
MTVMAISRDEVSHFAQLSGFDLAEEELDQLAPQLDEILTALARVQEVPSEGIPRTPDAWELIDAFRGGVTEDPPLDTREPPSRAPAAQWRVGVQPIAED